MKQLMLSSVLAVAANSSPAFSEEQSVEIAVSELTCPSCSFIVVSSMRGVPSVQINDFVEGPKDGHGVFYVTFDDAEASVERILEAVTANGFPAVVLTDPAS